jgi:hypothetical protein
VVPYDTIFVNFIFFFLLFLLMVYRQNSLVQETNRERRLYEQYMAGHVIIGTVWQCIPLSYYIKGIGTCPNIDQIIARSVRT